MITLQEAADLLCLSYSHTRRVLREAGMVGTPLYSRDWVLALCEERRQRYERCSWHWRLEKRRLARRC